MMPASHPLASQRKDSDGSDDFALDVDEANAADLKLYQGGDQSSDDCDVDEHDEVQSKTNSVTRNVTQRLSISERQPSLTADNKDDFTK